MSGMASAAAPAAPAASESGAEPANATTVLPFLWCLPTGAESKGL
jgi:hypothetical protein